MSATMTPVLTPVLTIDGPAGAGKGTVAKSVAADLGWHYLDSGALYRLVGLAAQKAGLAETETSKLGELSRNLDIVFDINADPERILLDGADVTQQVRAETTGELASRYAVVPEVRAGLFDLQQSFAKAPGLVADGRDMGTEVFPEAPHKVFLTASVEERAQRRYKQLKEKGIDANLARLCEDIAARDERDSQRATAPLRPADDALILDTTNLSIPEAVAKVRALVA